MKEINTIYGRYSDIKQNTSSLVLQWRCEGLAGRSCDNILNNIQWAKPRRICDTCKAEKKKERMRAHYRETKRKRFLKGA